MPESELRRAAIWRTAENEQLAAAVRDRMAEWLKTRPRFVTRLQQLTHQRYDEAVIAGDQEGQWVIALAMFGLDTAIAQAAMQLADAREQGD